MYIKYNIHLTYMKHNLTLVSAFMANVNSFARKPDFYKNSGTQLMKIKIPKIIFIDETVISQFENPLPEYNTIIPYKWSDIYLYKYKENLKNIIFKENPAKNTVEYMMVQCNKTEWVRKAIQINKYDSDQYMWIDFGIYQIVDRLNISEETKYKRFNHYMTQIQSSKYNLVRIPYIYKDAIHTCPNIYENICWTFAGSLFGGNKEKLIIFADLMKSYCMCLIKMKNWLMWEINIWAIIYTDHPQYFDLYYGNHDTSMLENYPSTGNINLIRQTLDKYLSEQKYSEAQMVINNIDHTNNITNMEMYVHYSILTNFYTMNKNLNQNIIDILNDPVNHDLRKNIIYQDGNNINYYQNKWLLGDPYS